MDEQPGSPAQPPPPPAPPAPSAPGSQDLEEQLADAERRQRGR